MWHTFSPGASFWAALSAWDDEVAEQTWEKGCLFCGGGLCRADYGRKPRGLPPEAEEEFSRRRSFCCGRCRRRTTPPSVRFFGRRVYVGWLVFVAVVRGLGQAVAQWATVPGRTVVRWRTWWRAGFVATSFWKRALGRLLPPPPAPDELPAGLLDRFPGSPAEQLVGALRFVAPVTQ